MKLLLATAISGALLVGLFLLPIGGRTLWQRAESRGYPQSAARAMSSGAHAAVRWAESKEPRPNPPENMPGHRAPPRRDVVARVTPPAPVPAAHPQIAATPTKLLPAAPSAAPVAPAAAHDHIIAAPPAESLSSKDRQGLDQLIAGAGHPRR